MRRLGFAMPRSPPPPATQDSEIALARCGRQGAAVLILLAVLLSAGCGDDLGDSIAAETGTSDGSTTQAAAGSSSASGREATSTGSTGSGEGEQSLSYASDVYPILAGNCGCHITEFKANPNVPILDPDTSYDVLLGDSSWQVPSMRYIVAGDLDGSYVVQKVAGTAGDLGTFPSRMPLLGGDLAPADYLSDEDVDVMNAWVIAGAAP